MAWLRHSPRHIHATIVEYLTDQLTDLGWLDSTEANRPFGAPQIRIQSYLPPESELTKVTAGLVAITMGGEFDAQEEEIGGPLHSQELPFFVDCFMDKSAHGMALATDVRDALRGRFSGGARSMLVKDFSESPAVETNWRFEFTDIRREQIYRLPIYWQSIRATAMVEFLEEVY